MGKRYVDHDSTLDTPTNKKRKTESTHQQFVNDATTEHINQLTATAAAAAATTADATDSDNTDVTYSLTTDLVDGAVLTDLCAKKWRCGKPIGKIWNLVFFFIFYCFVHNSTGSNGLKCHDWSI